MRRRLRQIPRQLNPQIRPILPPTQCIIPSQQANRRPGRRLDALYRNLAFCWRPQQRRIQRLVRRREANLAAPLTSSQRPKLRKRSA